MILDVVFIFLCIVSLVCVVVLRKEEFFKRYCVWYCSLMFIIVFLMIKFTVLPYKYIICKIITTSLWVLGAIGICTDKFKNITAKNFLFLVIISLAGNFAVGYFC